MTEARTPLAYLMERAAEAHAVIYRAAGCEVTVGAGNYVVDHGPRLAARQIIGAEPPQLEPIWRYGHDRSCQRVSVKHYTHFTDVITEQNG